MPIYQYRCQSCSELHEALQKVSDERLTTCPHCGEEALRRIIAPVGIQFKGSGWHVTDYKSSASSSMSSTDEGGKDKKKPEDTSKSSEGSKSEGSKSGEGSKGSDTSKGSGDTSASSKVA